MKIFGFAGYSGSGKATLIGQLFPLFAQHGLKVSLIKHAHHTFDVDTPGKDSYRHRHAGASGVLVTASRRWVLMHELRGAAEPNLNQLGALSNVDLVWHTDMSYIEVPPDASILHALEVPAAGGETGFCNMYRALETLPQTLRARVNGVSIKHDATHNSGGFLRKGFEPPADVTRSPGPGHPAVRTHPETGCDTLYLGRRPYSHVQGLPVAESEALLDQLWAHAARPEFAWYHQWAVGDVVIWDNRCTMHRRNAFDNAARRIMHRTQIKGTRPYADAPRGRQPPHPRGLGIGATMSPM